MTSPTALIGARIFDGFRVHADSALLFADDRIVGLIPAGHIPTGYRTIQLAGGLLAPGFIDLQINGGGGVLLNNVPTEQTMLTMAQSQVPFGVTRILPTVISDTVEVTDQAISAAQRCLKQDSGVLGIHIEGPFFSGEKSGVHRADKIRALVSSDWLWLERLAGLPSILTLAPERVSAEAIARIAALG
ncbi:MAG: N-acetylglucosamine-6-phosphate deacetylase, partial [Reinekea sp.]